MSSPALRRLVVKIGTSTLTAGTASIATPSVLELARQLAALRSAGHEVILVSSGAMAAGREQLGFPALPAALPARQMLSAVGQPRLMALYEQVMGLLGHSVAQVLLTRTDLSRRRSYLNARDTLHALLDQGVMPIVNENDAVATEEIRVGDNDNLSALVANVVAADLLVLLTDQAGLFTGDPRRDPDAELIREVDAPEVPPEVWRVAGGSGELGTGGMATKVQAADLARRSGTPTVIAAGDAKDVLLRAARGEDVGTRFCAVGSRLESRKRYILSGGGDGVLTVDDGARAALAAGKSLLPVGIVAIRGSFERGDTVRVLAADRAELCRGLVEYAAAELERIRGRRSEEIAGVLGYSYADEVIHRDDLVRSSGDEAS